MASGILLEDGSGVVLLEPGGILLLESDTGTAIHDPIGSGPLPFSR